MSARHFALAVVLSVGCHREEKRPAPAPAPRVAMVAAEISYERVVESAAKLAIADALPAESVRAHAAALRANAEAGASKLVDELLSDQRFAADVAVGLIVREHFAASNLPVSLTLRTAPGPEPIYYLRAACSAGAAERVSPWWAPNTTVLVCPDSHRPEVTGDGRYRCGGRMLDAAASPTCGCGPQLVQCARDPEHLRQIRASVRSEVADTIAYTVEHDEPVAQVFLRNDTVRDATTEVFDRRWRLMNGEKLTLADVPQGKAALRPRTEGFVGHHAGILTTPHMLYRVDAPRAMLRVFYELMWCQAAASANVSTDAVLGLKALDLRQGEGWKELAAMPICTNCHARLDYGVQFFSGFPSPIHGLDFVPARHKTGEGPLYGANIGDKIGVAPLTPRAFAERAVAREDFAQCMVKSVAEHVFGPGENPDDRPAMLDAFRTKPTLRNVMREALLRFVRRQLAPRVAAVEPKAPAVSKADGGLLPVGTALRAAIDDRCVDCHDDDDAGPSLTPQSLPRATVASMLNQIAFYGMPKNQALGDDTRAAMVTELVAMLWPDAAAREQPLRFYLDGMRALRVHRPSAVLQSAQTSLNDHEQVVLGAIEQSLSPRLNQYTPGYAATIAMLSLTICKNAHKTGEELEKCIDHYSAPSAAAVDP